MCDPSRTGRLCLAGGENLLLFAEWTTHSDARRQPLVQRREPQFVWSCLFVFCFVSSFTDGTPFSLTARSPLVGRCVLFLAAGLPGARSSFILASHQDSPQLTATYAAAMPKPTAAACTFIRFGSIGLLAHGQQCVSSQHHSRRLVTCSIRLRALGQQSVSSQLHSPRLVTSSLGLLAFGQQFVGLRIHSLRLVTSSIGLLAHGQQFVSSQHHSLRLVTCSIRLRALGSNLSVRSVNRLGSSLAVLVCLHMGWFLLSSHGKLLSHCG
jgi:hypothetical protein